jgi:hypothetical protein|tara:strand:- start:1206 stop:1403 length:198 start_codon:yes stop_codon:yes gene_type:complete
MSVNITRQMFQDYVKANKTADMDPTNPFDTRARFMTNLTRKQWDIIAKDYSKFAESWLNNNNGEK